MSDDLIGWIVFGSVGLVLVVIGAINWFRIRLLINRSQEVKGTVVRFVSSYSSNRIIYFPVFKFKTLDGQTIEAAGDLATNPPQFREGQIVDILYDPENPQQVRVKKWLNLYFLPLLLGGLGVLFGGISLVFIVLELSAK